MQLSRANQESHAARQVVGGPDFHPQSNNSQAAQLFRRATAHTIVNGTSAEHYAPPGLEAEIDRIRKAVSGNGHYFTGTA